MALWIPSDASTALTIWLKADAITGKADGDSVATWSDISGASADATNGSFTAPVYKTSQINGLPVVRFSASAGSALRAFPNPLGSGAQYSMFAFGRLNGGADGRLVGSIYAAYRNWLLGWWNGNEDVMYAEGFVAGGGTVATTNWHSYSSYFDGTNTTFNDYGNLIASNGSGVGGPNGALALSGYEYPSGTQELSNGDLAEVIMYDGNLSDDDRYRVEGYLAWKYGKQAELPGGHAYAGAAPTISDGNATFNVTIDHTKVAANLTNFPIYVDLSDMPSGFWSTVSDGGGDIRCYASNGTTELAREVVSCDTATSTGELHIKADVSSSADTILKIQVNGIDTEPSVSSTYGSQNVWSNSYTSVYHLSQDPSGSAPQTKDSTSNGYDGTSSGVWSAGDLIDGKLNKGLTFNGTDHTIQASTSAVPTGISARTTSIWANQATAANTAMWAFGSLAAGELWEMMAYSGSLIWHGYGGGNDTVSVSAPISTGVWNYVVLTYDGSFVGVYVNGAYKGGKTVSINTTQTQNDIGGPGYFSRWNGSLDEARLSSVARSADWVTTEYNNQSSPSAFYSIFEDNPPPFFQGITSITGLSSIQF